MTDSGKQPTDEQQSKSEQEKKNINIGLRGGKNVEQKEEELESLGGMPGQSGVLGGQPGRDYRAEQELKSDEARAEGRQGGRPERASDEGR